jgi:hypothetical protein
MMTACPHESAANLLGHEHDALLEYDRRSFVFTGDQIRTAKKMEVLNYAFQRSFLRRPRSALPGGTLNCPRRKQALLVWASAAFEGKRQGYSSEGLHR